MTVMDERNAVASCIRPIGVFDSGLGGLTVVKALRRLMPQRDIVYFGDTARVPYGTKSPRAIRRFSIQNAAVLTAFDVEAIVVACNSSSSHALSAVKASVEVDVVGVVEAGAREAVKATRNGRIGVIATAATVRSMMYPSVLKQLDRSVRVMQQACPLFVPLIEEGWIDDAVTETVAGRYLAPLKKAGIDTLILGCTHYPVLKPLLRRVLGGAVHLIDSALAVARQVNRLLPAVSTDAQGDVLILVSDEPVMFKRLARRFMGREVFPVHRLTEGVGGLRIPADLKGWPHRRRKTSLDGCVSSRSAAAGPVGEGNPTPGRERAAAEA